MSQGQRVTGIQRRWWKFSMVLPWMMLGTGVSLLFMGLSQQNYVAEMVGVSLMTASVITASLLGMAAFVIKCLRHW